MLKVLVADKNSSYVDQLKGLVDWRMHGFEIVACALNCQELVEKYMCYHPNLVIMEFEFRGGIEALNKLMTPSIHCELVFLSDHKRFDNVQTAIHIGAFDYIIKMELDMDYLERSLDAIRLKILKDSIFTGSI